jgi:ATP-binding cassette subfamily F protein uup
VCGYLKDFLFDPRMVFHPVSILSGGQKNRLMLAKILAKPGNLLILDEPTNDLDMDTLDMLEDILAEYTGTLIVVSHDRDFLDQTVSKILAFEGNGVVEAVIGGYQDYIAAKKRRAADRDEVPEPDESAPISFKKPAATAAKAAKSNGKKLSYALQYELEGLPAKIQALEHEISEIEPRLADPDFYARDADAFHKLISKHANTKKKLEAAEARWLELEEMRIGSEAS